MAVNHTSTENAWFKNAVADSHDPDHNKYLWFPKIPKGWNPKNFTLVPRPRGSEAYYHFFSPTMPDLNWRQKSVADSVKHALHFWVEHGVDGFRLDAVRYYVEAGEPLTQGKPQIQDTKETHQVLQDFAQDLRKSYPNKSLFFVGECFADAPTIKTYIASSEELDLAFNFPTAFSLISSIKKGKSKRFDRVSKAMDLS